MRSILRPMAVLSLLAVTFLVPAAAHASSSADLGDSGTHRMMLLVVQLGVILFVARLGNILFEKLRLPGALGELVAGILIGPYALGQIGFIGFPEGLFPFHPGQVISPELTGMTAVAAVVLLFTAGLDTDLELLLRYSLAGALAGAGGVVASFFLGAATVMWMSPFLFGQQLGLFAPQCLIIGVVTTATSVGISARILSEKRKLDSPEGVTILSAAVIDDVIGIILLAIVMGITSAAEEGGRIDWGHIGLITAKATGIWLSATAIGLLASRRISNLLKWFGERTSIAIMTLGFALVLAGLFEQAGLAMIIGAYVMGLSLSKADIGPLVREKLQPIYELLVPVFFCAMGMRINLSVFVSPGLILFGLVYAVVAVGAKFFGCGLPSLAAGFNWRGAARVGFGMAPRAEVALIVASIGLGGGLLSSDLFAAVVFMVLFSALVAPSLLVLSFRSQTSGLRREPVSRRAGVTTFSFQFPSEGMSQFIAGKLLGVFESDGYLVYPVYNRRGRYQLRKEESMVELIRAREKITFSCAPATIALVNTAMQEALAGLQKAVKDLREPVEPEAIQAEVPETPRAQDTRPMLSQYLSPDLIKVELKGSTKVEVIDELLDLLHRHGQLDDQKAARAAVLTREESLSTGLQNGLAIPHGKTDSVSGLVCALGLKKEGMDFDSMDGRPTRIVILTLSPETRPAPHVQFMSRVSQFLDNVGRAQLLSCTTSEEAYAFLTGRPVSPVPARLGRLEALAPVFNLSTFLLPEHFKVPLVGQTKEEVIEELLRLLEQSGAIADLPRAASAVLAREEYLPTGIRDGIALPHGRSDAVTGTVAAFGIHREGIDFGGIDGQPARIIVLTLTSESTSGPYLQFVASIIRLILRIGRERILAVKTAEELARRFVEAVDEAETDHP